MMQTWIQVSKELDEDWHGRDDNVFFREQVIIPFLNFEIALTKWARQVDENDSNFEMEKRIHQSFLNIFLLHVCTHVHVCVCVYIYERETDREMQ